MKVNNLNVPPIFFWFYIKKLKLERLAEAESRDKLYNVAAMLHVSRCMWLVLYMYWVSFLFPLFYISVFIFH